MRFRYLLAIAALAALMPGCGGGSPGQSSDTGRAVVRIDWPSRSRLIPVASNSIKVVFSRGTQVLASQVIPRPASGDQTTVTFQNLKTGDLSLAATAFPTDDGTGVAQATGATTVTIRSGQTTPVTLTMNSTIDHLEVRPANPTVLVGANAQLSVAAKNAAGDVVLLAVSKIHWTTADATYATVDDTGKANGIKPTGATPGPVTLRVTDQESGKTANVGLAVTSSTVVTVNPGSAELSPGDQKSFSATVTKAPDTSVTWSVQEGASGGTVDSQGKYASPAQDGTYHVLATSVYDNAVSATATVKVGTGGSHVIIN